MEPIVGLDLNNFQSFHGTNLDFDPGFNVLVGPSNLGKSAAIRAIRALVYNAPATGLIRNGAAQLEVVVWFADGQRIGLTKGKNKSEYDVNGDLFAKSGANEAPSAVQDMWSIAENKLSFATQHEPPFLLAEPASKVAQVIGDLTNASMLTDAVASCNKQRTAANADAKARHREADEAREEILSHAGLTTRGSALKSSRSALNAATDLTNKWQSLTFLKEAYDALQSKKSELANLTESSVSFDDLVTEADRAAVHFSDVFTLSEQYQKLNADKAQAKLNREIAESNAEKAETEIHNLLETAGVCPVCEQRIK